MESSDESRKVCNILLTLSTVFVFVFVFFTSVSFSSPENTGHYTKNIMKWINENCCLAAFVHKLDLYTGIWEYH